MQLAGVGAARGGQEERGEPSGTDHGGGLRRGAGAEGRAVVPAGRQAAQASRIPQGRSETGGRCRWRCVSEPGLELIETTSHIWSSVSTFMPHSATGPPSISHALTRSGSAMRHHRVPSRRRRRASLAWRSYPRTLPTWPLPSSPDCSAGSAWPSACGAGASRPWSIRSTRTRHCRSVPNPTEVVDRLLLSVRAAGVGSRTSSES